MMSVLGSQTGMFALGYGAVLGAMAGMFARDFTELDVGDEAPLVGGVGGAVLVLVLASGGAGPSAGKPPAYR